MRLLFVASRFPYPPFQGDRVRGYHHLRLLSRRHIAGRGRIIGEVCHFVDLIQHLTGSLPVWVYAETLASGGYQPGDNVVITLKMANGAIGSITYLAGGDKRYPRERVEVFGGGAVGVIENFKAATFTRGGRMRCIRNWLNVDRGHRGEVEALLSAIRNGSPAPWPLRNTSTPPWRPLPLRSRYRRVYQWTWIHNHCS